VLVFLDSRSGFPPVGALSPVKEDGKEVLGLKASLSSLGGAWPPLGGAIPSFAEVVRSQGLVMLRIERRELDLLLVVRLAAPEVVRLAMDCSVLEKEPLGKGLNLQSKGLPARLPSTQGTTGSARKPLPRLKMRTWMNLLVRMVGRVIGSLMGRSVGFGLGLKPNLRFLGFCLGRVLAKPKSKIWIEGTS